MTSTHGPCILRLCSSAGESPATQNPPAYSSERCCWCSPKNSRKFQPSGNVLVKFLQGSRIFTDATPDQQGNKPNTATDRPPALPNTFTFRRVQPQSPRRSTFVHTNQSNQPREARLTGQTARGAESCDVPAKPARYFPGLFSLSRTRSSTSSVYIHIVVIPPDP